MEGSVNFWMGNTWTAKQCSNKWYEHFKHLSNADLMSLKEWVTLTRCEEDSSLASGWFVYPCSEVHIWLSSLTQTNHLFRIALPNVQDDDKIRWEDLTNKNWKGWTTEKLWQHWVELKVGAHMPNDTHHSESHVSGCWSLVQWIVRCSSLTVIYRIFKKYSTLRKVWIF